MFSHATSGDLPDASPIALGSLRRFLIRAAAVVGVLTAAVFGWVAGSHKPFTPAGYVGYLTKGAVFGQSRFYGVQRAGSA